MKIRITEGSKDNLKWNFKRVMKFFRNIIVVGLIATPFIVPNILAFNRIADLEERVYILEEIIISQGEAKMEGAIIQAAIRELNPKLPDHRVSQYATAILESARDNRIDPYLFTQIGGYESEFRHKAVSRKGAVGLYQIMPGTFRGFYPDGDIGNWRDNIECGARYYRHLLDMFGDEKTALAAYNCGPGRPIYRILAISGGYANEVLRRTKRMKEGFEMACMLQYHSNGIIYCDVDITDKTLVDFIKNKVNKNAYLGMTPAPIESFYQWERYALKPSEAAIIANEGKNYGLVFIKHLEAPNLHEVSLKPQNGPETLNLF